MRMNRPRVVKPMKRKIEIYEDDSNDNLHSVIANKKASPQEEEKNMVNSATSSSEGKKQMKFIDEADSSSSLSPVVEKAVEDTAKIPVKLDDANITASAPNSSINTAEETRPITPKTEIVGNLLEDINSDLAKYSAKSRAARVEAAGFHNYNDTKNTLLHTISFYRKQESAKRGAPLDGIDELVVIDSSTTPKTHRPTTSKSSAPPPPTNEATLKRLQVHYL